MSADDWKQFYRERLPQHLDKQGDLAPPWEEYPHYERHTIGWRMGYGESWMIMWGLFLADLDPSLESRLAYLKRHAPAPICWASAVYDVLYPSEDEREEEAAEEAHEGEGALERRVARDKARREELLQRGLIASDIAYSTWLKKQKGVQWPWIDNDTPEDAARYSTRDLWLWSRQVASLRSDPAWEPPSVPEKWQSCAAPLETGRTGALDLRCGLLSVAQCLAAGRVIPPWELGLTPDDFTDSFEMDMGYVDAYRLWGSSAFDDRPQMLRYVGPHIPEAWQAWVSEHFLFDD